MTNNHLKFAGWLASLLDNRFKIGNFSFGLDPLINLVPVIGPIITLSLSLYILWIARDMGAPLPLRATMMRNVAIDFVLGVIPGLGTIGDFLFKANIRNLALLEKWAEQANLEGEIVSSQRLQVSM